MKKYIVTIKLITGYRDQASEVPILRTVEIRVSAETENEAIQKAQKLETSYLSVWDVSAMECE